MAQMSITTDHDVSMREGPVTSNVYNLIVSEPMPSQQAGLIAAGNREVSFSDFEIKSDRPRAFVVMQFAEPLHTFYREAIQKRAAIG
jgi:hypothetical protein